MDHRVCDLDALLKDFSAFEHEKGQEVEATRGTEVELDGARAVEISARPGGVALQRTWVLSESPHRVVKMTVEGGREPVVLALSEFDEPFEVEAPNGGDTARL